MAIRLILYMIGILFLIKGVYVLTMALALKRTGGALYCTTHRAKIAAVLDAVPLLPGQTVLELGCGDARFLAAAIRRYGINGIGYEINLLPWVLARLRQLRWGGQLRVLCRDFRKADLGGADLVFCYLFPDILVPLAEKARRELRAGAVLVSCNFPLPDWEPERVLMTDNPGAPDPIYLYRKGGGVETEKERNSSGTKEGVPGKEQNPLVRAGLVKN
jgi:SAM-dependent methyltransferase